MIMVFEKIGRLRYHALWAYVLIVLPSILLDKIEVSTVEGLTLVLAPIALVITADIIKNRNTVSK